MRSASGPRLLRAAPLPSWVWWPASIGAALGLALLCCRSVLHDGYLLMVDTVWGPRAMPAEAGFYAPIGLLQQLGVTLVGGKVTGAVYVIGVLTLSAWAPMLLLRSYRWWVQAAAGLLGALNPWTYERVVDGQWTVAAAAATLVLWLAAFESLQRAPDPWRALRLAAAGVLVVAFSANFLGMIVLLALVGLAWRRAWRDPALVRWNLAAAGMLAGLLLYGLIPFFLGSGAESYARVHSFGRADYSFFRAADGDHGLLANLVGLQGYWGERAHRWDLVGGATWWPVAALLLVGLAVIGAWAHRDRAWLLVAGGIGLLFSASTALPGGVDAVDAIAQRLPLLAGFREPEKWSALWLLTLVVLGAEAVARAGALRLAADGGDPASPPERRGARLAGLAAAAVMAGAALLPAGLAEIRQLPATLTPVSYPADWYRVDDYLQAHAGSDDRVLVLPWHLYEALPFTGNRLVQNPAPVFFHGDLVVSDDPEIPGGAVPSSPHDVGALAVAAAPAGCALGDAVRGAGISWVVVLPILEGGDDLDGLRACGFTVMAGAPGGAVLLRG